MVALAILAVTRAAYYSHDPTGFYTLFYVWIGLYAVFFFSRRGRDAAISSAIGVAYALRCSRIDDARRRSPAG